MPNAISLAWCWWGLRGRTRIATTTGRTGWGLWLTKIYGLQLRPKVKTKSWSWYPYEPDSYHFGFVYSPSNSLIQPNGCLNVWMAQFKLQILLPLRGALQYILCFFVCQKYGSNTTSLRHKHQNIAFFHPRSISSHPIPPTKKRMKRNSEALPSSFSSGFQPWQVEDSHHRASTLKKKTSYEPYIIRLWVVDPGWNKKSKGCENKLKFHVAVRELSWNNAGARNLSANPPRNCWCCCFWWCSLVLVCPLWWRFCCWRWFWWRCSCCDAAGAVPRWCC